MAKFHGFYIGYLSVTCWLCDVSYLWILTCLDKLLIGQLMNGLTSVVKAT